jgi:hypothetical protein
VQSTFSSLSGLAFVCGGVYLRLAGVWNSRNDIQRLCCNQQGLPRFTADLHNSGLLVEGQGLAWSIFHLRSTDILRVIDPWQKLTLGYFVEVKGLILIKEGGTSRLALVVGEYQLYLTGIDGVARPSKAPVHPLYMDTRIRIIFWME